VCGLGDGNREIFAHYPTDNVSSYNQYAANGVEDGERATFALRGAAGKRLTYQYADKLKLNL
jgi:hypothetical protein